MNETDARRDAGADAKTEQGADTSGDEGGERVDEDGASEPDTEALGASVITIATDRTLESDPTGDAIVTALKKSGHGIATREHINSDHDQVQSSVSRMLDREDIDIVVTGGATGVEPGDVTIEALEPLLEKELTTFTDLFTALAYEAVGTRAITARTLAGIADGIPVFCLPGDEDAARLGLDEIVLPEVHRLVDLAREAERDPESESAETDAAVDEPTENGSEDEGGDNEGDGGE
ncbi:MogA/MoaB family molybdenum cofactor biosynthesis protein [Natronorubrum halophilum]|uniref:MogA/MoaB family molybdenum cofactor biosynthesis protein n=1 Tax=Natronorubrum halophilum TaxID=1702106 RepID=UPI000EF6A3B5|nr:molybdopterin-binding protein [Natronorubrum halophilum]